MLRYLAAAVTLTVLLVAAGVSAGAERPGQRDWITGFGPHHIKAVDTAGDGRVIVAGESFRLVPSYTWVHAYLPDGRPDPGFGQDGRVDFSPDERRMVDAVVQPDARILLAQETFVGGSPLVERLTRDGRPDASFGSGGSIEPRFPAMGRVSLVDLALQADGRILVAGVHGDSTHFPGVVIIIGRYMPDGSLDGSFGGGGFTEVIAGDAPSEPELAPQPDGGVVLTANRGSLPVIARLDPDGRLDGSFGRGGLAPLEYGDPDWASRLYPQWDPPPAMILPGGRIRVGVGFRKPGERKYRMALVGLTKDGHPDLTFADRGLALGPLPSPPASEFVKAAVRDTRGGVLVSGFAADVNDEYGEAFPLIRRFRADGRLDRSFGRRGELRGSPASGYIVTDRRLAFLGDDRLLVGENRFDGKYGFSNDTSLTALHAGYDDAGPEIAILRRGCRTLHVRISDLSGMDKVVVRAAGRVIRRTSRKQFRVRPPDGARWAFVRAIDLAGNHSGKWARLPRC